MTARDQSNICRARFHVGNNVGRKNHDPFAREFRKQIAKADPLFRIQTGGRLIHDEKLGIIQERLGNPDTLFHPAGVTAQRTLPRLHEVDHFQEFLDSLTRGFPIEALGRGQIFQELNRIQVWINAESPGEDSLAPLAAGLVT